MSDLSSLQARLAQEQARNSELRGMLYELGSGVSNAYQEMNRFQNSVQGTLADSNRRIEDSHSNIIRAHELQLEIDKLYIRFKNMELANKKIRECDMKRYYDFSNYATIRKIVQGMLDNLNINMISDKTIYKSVEKQHLMTPDYWLTAALISIMAWKNDDKELASRSIDIALSLDKKSAVIFYMLFNIRMGRNESALKWFMLYQECELKGSDQRTFLMLFSLLSKTIKDNVEDEIKYEILDFINRVLALNANAENYSEQDMLDAIEYYLNRMKTEDDSKTNMLKRCIVDYKDMADIVASAQNNIHILQFIMDVANVSEIEKNIYIDQFINEEIAKPNKVELSIYEEIEYNELVIACGGDMKITEEKYAAKKEKKQKELNLISEIIEWIYKKSNDDEVNGQVRKNMFTLTENLQRKAIDQYVSKYRNRIKLVHPASLGDYETEIHFNDRSGEGQKIAYFYETQKNEQLSQLKYILSIIGAVIIVASIGLTIYTKSLPILFAVLVGIIMIVYNIVSNSLSKKHIIETCELNIRNKNEIMDNLFAEYKIYRDTIAEYDAYYEKIKEEIDRY